MRRSAFWLQPAVRLRPWIDADRPFIARAVRDQDVRRQMSLASDWSNADLASFLNTQMGFAQSGLGVSLAVVPNGGDSPVGLIMLQTRPQPSVAGIGFWIVSEARGHGYASNAISVLTDWGMHQGELARIEAWVEPDNLVARRALRSAGYRLEGRLRSFLRIMDKRIDVDVLSVIREDLPDLGETSVMRREVEGTCPPKLARPAAEIEARGAKLARVETEPGGEGRP